MRKDFSMLRPARIVLFGAAVLALASLWGSLGAIAAGTLAISQVPLPLATPNHPQVLIAVGNSQSMDGTLSGAIMTGSGSLSGGSATLSASSSPASYAVPAGFTPPVQAADASGNAPYTVSVGSSLTDNGASRLNVAKGGIQAILQAYMANTDFALADYNVSGAGLYSTWVYYMSPAGANFSYTSTPVAGNIYVPNPCFGYSTAAATVKSNCSAIVAAGLATAATLGNSSSMQIGASSDDPSINDVLYAGGQPAVFMDYGTPNPTSPFPPGFTLANYNAGSVLITYPNSAPSANQGTSPTNAGYVPYSKQVMYAQRGFGYYGSQTANSGNIVVPMTSAGTTPTTSSVATAINKFLPYLNPETNNASSSEIKASAVQSPIAGLLTQAQSYLSNSTVRSGSANNGCLPQQYVVLISDGLPTEDLAGKLWPPLGSASAQGYGVTATFNADGTLATTNDQALTDTLSVLASLKAAGIKTYIVGLGAGVDPSVNAQAAATLQAMALAGGTGAYYPASSPAALVSDLNQILISVQNGSLSTTASSVNSTKLTSSSVEYQASFTSSDTPYQDWTGEIFEKALDPATGKPTGPVLWSASAQLDAQIATGSGPAGRVIATWNPALASGAAFEWSNATTPAMAISTAQQALLQPSDSLGSSRLADLRGTSSLEKRNGGTFRNRSHTLGDIVNSQPLYVGAPAGPYVSSAYQAFERAKASRPAMLYAGANDGMLHAFNAGTGAEAFAFIPNGVFANLINLTAPLYNQNHLYFVDGSPASGDVQFADASWHTLLVGGEGGGGKTIYALDISDPASLDAESSLAAAVKWEFSDSGMGLSYSAPRIAMVNAAPGYAVFFGNGYNSASNHAILYAVNPQTGATLAKIDLCSASGVPATACNASLPEGLSTVTVFNADGLPGQPATQVYAGDLQGNLWAIDIGNATPSNWTVRLIFQARDASGNAQPITIAPVATMNPNYPRALGSFIFFGTGQFLTTGDLSSTQYQTAYGIWDKPGLSKVLLRANLQAQTLTRVAAATSGLPQDILTDTANTVNFASQYGWYDDFPTAGQRVLNDARLINGVFMATLNTPPANSCGTPAVPILLELNYATGGAPSQPQIDVNGSGTIDSADRYNGTNPVGIAVGSGAYGSSPTVVGPNKSNQIVKNITLSNGQQQSVINPNNSPRTTAWWQIQ